MNKDFTKPREFKLASAVLLAATLAACAQWPALSATYAHTGTFDQVMTITSPRFTSKQTDHLMFSGARYRLDSTDPDSHGDYSEIYDGQSDYYYAPGLSSALRLPAKGKVPPLTEQMQDRATQELTGARKTGETALNGFDCDVYTNLLPDGSKVTMYLSKDPQFPFIIKTQLNEVRQGVTQTTVIENVKVGAAVDDSQFTLPQGTKITDAPPAPAAAPADAPPASK